LDFVRNKLIERYRYRDKEDMNFVYSILYTMAILLFIGYKEESDKLKTITVHFTSESYRTMKRLGWTSTKFSTKDNYS
jgi:hypothetical protein